MDEPKIEEAPETTLETISPAPVVPVPSSEVSVPALTELSPQEAGKATEAMLARGAEIAKKLKGFIDSQGLSIRLGGDRPHVKFEGWSTLARILGLQIVITASKPESLGEIRGFVAEAELRDAFGHVVSRAEAACYDDEPQWKERKKRNSPDTVPVPLHALRSMSQTRAAGKVCRVSLSWIMTLAGYSTTPAEEMGGTPPPEAGPQTPQDFIADIQKAEDGLPPSWLHTDIGGKKSGKTWADAFRKSTPEEEKQKLFSYFHACVEANKRELEREEKDIGDLSNWSSHAMKCKVILALRSYLKKEEERKAAK